MEKQFGLILPDKSGVKKPAPLFPAAKNVFGNDSDSDEEIGVPKAPLRTGEKLKRQARLIQEKALEADPTVYQYDELYDDIEDKKKQAKSVQKEVKKPRYIEKLLHTATLRKKENERRVERQVQKEREEEGDKFADKESFVTSAYKNKLEEIKLEEEKELREKYLEEVGDVTKQADLGGFYRHLYEQQLQPEKSTAHLKHPAPAEIKEEKSEPEVCEDEKKAPAKKAKRTYRKRTKSGELKSPGKDDDDDQSQSGSDDEQVNRQNVIDAKSNKKPRTHLESNIDADSDFSIDDGSSSSSDDSDSKTTKSKSKKSKKDKTEVTEIKVEVKVEDADNFKRPNDVKSIDAKEVKTVSEKKVEPVVVKEVKPKVDIWKKRTVGEVFDQALQRYYERKSARGC